MRIALFVCAFVCFFAPAGCKKHAQPTLPQIPRRAGDTWVETNLEHSGDFGSGGFATAKDPSRPGVWLAVEELPNETRIDVWEWAPRPQ